MITPLSSENPSRAELLHTISQLIEHVNILSSHFIYSFYARNIDIRPLQANIPFSKPEEPTPDESSNK